MRVTIDFSVGPKTDAADLQQLLAWASRLDAAAYENDFGDAVAEARAELKEASSITAASVPASITVTADTSVKTQIESAAAVATALETPQPKRRGRPPKASVEETAKAYAAALAQPAEALKAPAQQEQAQTETPVQSVAMPDESTAWVPGVAVPPGMGVGSPEAMVTIPVASVPGPVFQASVQFPPLAGVTTPLPHDQMVQPQAPAMPVVPPGGPVNGPDGALTIDEFRAAVQQINAAKNGLPFRVLKKHGFFILEGVPENRRNDLVAEMQSETIVPTV